MKKKPIVFSDVDGTIYTSNGYVSNYNLNIIKNNELSFNIATGNPICPKMFKLAKLVNADYIIGSSGVQIYDFKRYKFVREEFINPKVVKKIFDIFREHKVSAAGWSSDAFYIFKEEDKEFLNRIYFRYETFDQFELYEGQDIKNVSKIEVYFETTENVDELIKLLKGLDVKLIKTHMNLEILPYGASKGRAILWMLENIFKNYSNNDVMVIGDSENDFSMFKRFNYSYAMDNSKDIVKEKAKYVTRSVQEHGLGIAILDYLSKFNSSKE
ncbi:Cof-type HAD-IIB family hydrolase [Mycoplasma zalophidermidis]|uniref:HAD family hydrolase n=1 Tax=Mycoplasma zalophidermidis TaxID=398174 RepID=A0ABS6DT33_9MOLU|nr:Cof-type HAD-IIB family hydrolase [Mycoplasma zalophidermidis]MBU4689939.1 HAD family hydrolase [Mycoplasma zalophidermidis]MBU4693770.1 HAD family hydrolase [Mycoplasma zalophidermidis]MCR8966776.1 HAD family hydrolase [Mycoplasma zalophidermidis]